MASIGIDLGTTYSCVAVMRKGKVEIIANDLGNRTTPSCVAFTEQERLIGEAAKQQLRTNAKNTIYDAKRIIGRKFGDPVVQTDMRNWSFEVFEEDEKPKIGVKYKKQRMEFYPEEISSMILVKLKVMAEEYIGEKIISAVITVPAYFNDGQRRATRDAAEIAELNIVKMINEPTSAALAYGLDKKGSARRNILIFDLGGGTFDVTVLTMGDGRLDVLATGGDTHLGGQDFNERLYKHLVNEFARKNKMDMSKDERAKHRLLEECEKAKRILSCSRCADVMIDSLYNHKNFETQITRAQFEDMNDDLFRATMETVGKVLDDAKMKKEKIDDIVLVGGSTRIPYVSELLGEYFGKDKICKTINPDEAVAHGAAIQAAMLSGDVSAELKSLELHDVTPLSLGLEKRSTIMNFVVKRNTKIPVVKSVRHVTLHDNQDKMTLKVFEGERTETRLNHFLGSFTISDLPLLPARQAKVNVCFDIDANGILNVTGTDLSRPENEVKVRITWDKGRWSDQDIEKMVKEAKKFRQEDETRKMALILLSDVEILAKKGQRLAKESNRASDSERIKLRDKSNEILDWIGRNQNATTTDSAMKKKEMEAVLRPFK